MDTHDRDTVETRAPARAGARVLRRVIVLAVLGGIVVVAAGAAFSPRLRERLLGGGAATVPLRLNSTPEGADAYVDDHLVGRTPVEVSVTPVPHRVRIVRRGFLPWHEQVDPLPTPAICPKLEQLRLATLIVESAPDRAEVHLDEERRGLTPVEIPGVEAGPHTLRVVKAPVYQPVTQRIDLKEGETRRIVVHLESGLEQLYEDRIKNAPGRLSNYTELLHVHILGGEVEKATGTLVRAVEAVKGVEVPPAELDQFIGELRRLFRGQGGALDAASRSKVLDAALDLLDKLVTAAPSEYTRYGDLVALLCQAGRFEDVYKVCEKTVAQATGRGLAHYYVATACSNVGETTSAIRLLERAVELQPTLFTARLSLGSAYHRAAQLDDATRQKRLDDALRQFTEAEKLASQASAYYQGYLQAELARLMVSRKDIPAAFARYKRAIAAGAPPSYACQWRVAFAELLLEQGNQQEAIEQYKEVVRLADPDSKVHGIARVQLRRLGGK